ncbi:MAG: hypothetical protein V8Q83_04295 [Blautia sp.]
MKQKYCKHITALIVAVILICNCMINICVYAGEFETPGFQVTVLVDRDNIRIDTYTDNQGNYVVREFDKGVLVQQNTIEPKSSIIKRKFYNSRIVNGKKSDILNANRYGTIRNLVISEPILKTTSSTTHHYAGTINYQALTSNGTKKYGLKCKYETYPKVQTTYRIHKYVGLFTDLVSIVAGALAAPPSAISDFLFDLVFGSATEFFSGVVENAFSANVAAIKTKYRWRLTNTKNVNHKKYVYGAKYYINETNSKYYHKTYYTGYVPRDWKTRALGLNFHNEMFSYSSFNIVSWTK